MLLAALHLVEIGLVCIDLNGVQSSKDHLWGYYRVEFKVMFRYQNVMSGKSGRQEVQRRGRLEAYRTVLVRRVRCRVDPRELPPGILRTRQQSLTLGQIMYCWL